MFLRRPLIRQNSALRRRAIASSIEGPRHLRIPLLLIAPVVSSRRSGREVHRTLKPSDAMHMGVPAAKSIATSLLFVAIATVLPTFAQSGAPPAPAATQNSPAGTSTSSPKSERQPDELKQELDADALALSQIPADPLLDSDPIAPIVRPFDDFARVVFERTHLKFGATYTFLNQYATNTPQGSVRHNQFSGRLDFTAAWSAYDNGSSAGSISILVRSGENIGISQRFNLSDSLGSGLFLNCLQGGGQQRPITLNILYWRQDFLRRRLSFYVGKIHPNEYISLSMFNNDERAQFLNGQNDGNLAFASDGAYAGGAAFEFQATRHFYIHAVVVDTEGAAQDNIATLVDRKYMEAIELGWFSGSVGEQYRDYRIGFWRDDTKTLGSGYGGGFGFEHEFPSGWAPFGRFGFATETGTAIKQTATLGLAQVQPFGRRGDMFGAAFNYTVPTNGGKHHESVFETFYRLRLTQSIDLGPDLEISVHPTFAPKAYVTALLGVRMRIIF
jgi:porin